MTWYWPSTSRPVQDATGELADLSSTYGAGGQMAQALAQALGSPGLSQAAAMDQLRTLLAAPYKAVARVALGPSGDTTGITDDAALAAWVAGINAGTGSPLLGPGQFFISQPIPVITRDAVVISGGGWAQSAATAGTCITATAGFSGSQMMSVSGEGVGITGITLDAANHVATNLVVTGEKIQLRWMQVRGNMSSGVGIDLQAGSNSAYLGPAVNINGINGGTGLQVASPDMIMTACKPQNSTVNVILLSGASGALLEANHWTPGGSSQTCVQVNGNPSNIALVANRFDNYVRSAIQFSTTTSTPQNVLIATNIFKSVVMADATWALIGVDTTSFGIRDLHIVGNVAYASATFRPLSFLAAQTAAGAAATNPTRLSTVGTVCNSNGAWVSGTFFGASSTPTVARGNMITTDGSAYAAVADT